MSVAIFDTLGLLQDYISKNKDLVAVYLALYPDVAGLYSDVAKNLREASKQTDGPDAYKKMLQFCMNAIVSLIRFTSDPRYKEMEKKTLDKAGASGMPIQIVTSDVVNQLASRLESLNVK